MSMPQSSERNEGAARERLRLWLSVLKLSRMMDAEIRERLRREHATTLPRFDVLAALYRSENGLKMSELSGELKVSNGNVTGIVDRLVADGLVVRAQVKGDRRAMRVRLTRKGEETFGVMADEHLGWIDELLEDVSAGEAQGLGAALRRIAGGIERRGRA